MFKLQGLHFTMENDTQLSCPTHSADSLQQLRWLSFWIEGVVISAVAIIGIFGNILAIAVFARKNMRNSFNLLLVALACFDAMYLFLFFVDGFRRNFLLTTETHTILFPYFLYPVQSIVFKASIFMIVSIAIERFTVVCQPQKYADAMLEKHAVAKRVVKYVGCVTILAVVLSVNKFFEAKLVTRGDTVSIGVTQLRTHPTYSKVSQWTNVIFTGVLPFILLICLYTKIFLEVKNRTIGESDCGEPNVKSDEEEGETVAFQMTEMSNAQQLEPSNSRISKNQMKEEDKLAMIFLAIVMVFLFCHLPRLIVNIHETFTLDNAMECFSAGKSGIPVWALMTSKISHLFLVINSAINFLFYTCLSPRFRQECKKLLKCC